MLLCWYILISLCSRLGMFDSYSHVVVLQSGKWSSMGRHILMVSLCKNHIKLSHIYTLVLYSRASTVINKMVFGVSLENIHFGTWTRCTEPKMVIFGQCLSVCPCPAQASGLLNLVDRLIKYVFWLNIFIRYLSIHLEWVWKYFKSTPTLKYSKTEQ